MTVWKLIKLFELSKWITQPIVLNKWIEPARNFKKCQCTIRVDGAAVAQKYAAHGIGSAMSTVQPVNDENDSMFERTNPDWRIEWKSRLSETDSSEYSPFDSVYMLMHRNTRPICELYFQYTRVLIFLLMRFLSIFYRIEQCASVCVQLRLFSISFVRLDRLVWFGCFFPFILHLSTLECDIRCVRLYACLYVCMYE